MSENGASVIIIGGGVTGLSAAWWLAKSGVDVLVLEKGIVGWEASGRNGGGCTHYMSPLFDEEQRLWPQMDGLLGYPTEYRRERIIFSVDQTEVTFYRRMIQNKMPPQYKWDELDGKQVRELVPLAGDNAAGGAYLHFGGHANPQRTVQAYAFACQDLGGRILQHTAVTGFETVGGEIKSVLTTRGSFGCDHVVIAAGPQCGHLMEMLGAYLPMAPARAEMIVTEPLPLMPIGGVDGNGLYGRQTLRGNLAYGGGPHEWLDEVPATGEPPRPSTPVLRNLALRLRELFPKAAHVRLIRSWAGVIENTPDGRPVLERLSAPSNATIATMSSVGFGLSPATGHAIRDLVIDGRCSFADLSKLNLARFKDVPPDWRRRQGWYQPAAEAGLDLTPAAA